MDTCGGGALTLHTPGRRGAVWRWKCWADVSGVSVFSQTERSVRHLCLSDGRRRRPGRVMWSALQSHMCCWDLGLIWDSVIEQQTESVQDSNPQQLLWSFKSEGGEFETHRIHSDTYKRYINTRRLIYKCPTNSVTFRFQCGMVKIKMILLMECFIRTAPPAPGSSGAWVGQLDLTKSESFVLSLCWTSLAHRSLTGYSLHHL